MDYPYIYSRINSLGCCSYKQTRIREKLNELYPCLDPITTFANHSGLRTCVVVHNTKEKL